MHQERSSLDWLIWAPCALAGLVLLYFLTAPPIIMAAWEQGGKGSIPWIYDPVLAIIESDYNGPLLWYFNEVWDSGILVLSNDPTTPSYQVALYVALGVAVVATVVYPVLRRTRKVQRLTKRWRQRAIRLATESHG